MLITYKIKELIQRYFSKKSGEQIHKYLVIGSDRSCFVKSHSKYNNTY